MARIIRMFKQTFLHFLLKITTKNSLLELGFLMTDSKANFLLIKHPSISGKDLYLKLKEKGILVRYLGGDISEYVRVTIGSDEQMNKFIQEIKQIIS